MPETYIINSQTHPVCLLDFTGTLVNTEPLHHKTYEAVLSGIGVSFLPYKEYRAKYIGKTAEDIFSDFVDEGTDKLIEKRRQLYSHLVSDGGVELTVGAIDFLENCQKKGVGLGLVSTSRREELRLILGALELENVFNVTLAREDISRRKPDPEGYITVLERLKKEPEQSVVFEDTQSGFNAAEGAGVKKIFGITQHAIEKPGPTDKVVFIRDFTKIKIV